MMSNVRPPRYSLQPPDQRFGPSPAAMLVLVILFVFAFLMFCWGLAAFGTLLTRPRPRMAMNRPVVGRPIKNGWSWYHIPALELSIAAFSQPEPSKVLAPSLKGRRDIAEFANYVFNRNGHRDFVIAAYWMRGERSSLKAMGDFQESQLKKHHLDYTSSSQTPVVVDGWPGMMVSVEFPWHDLTWVARSVSIEHGSVHYYFAGDILKAPKKASEWHERAFDYMLKSIKFDPATP